MFKIIAFLFIFLLTSQIHGQPCYPHYPPPRYPIYPPPVRIYPVKPIVKIEKKVVKKPAVTDSSMEKEPEVVMPSGKAYYRDQLAIIIRDIEKLNKMVEELRSSLGQQKHKVPQPLMLKPSEIIGKEATVEFPNYKRN